MFEQHSTLQADPGDLDLTTIAVFEFQRSNNAHMKQSFVDTAFWTLILVLTLCGSGLAFRFGFGRLSSAVGRKSVLKCSAEQIEAKVVHQFGNIFDTAQRSNLNNFRTEIINVVLPAIKTSPLFIEKYPGPLNRTTHNILGGLSDVTDIEYLNTLPANDPRRNLLSTIQDPGPERRAELMENLQAIDAERKDDIKNKTTYLVYQRLSRDELDANLVNSFKTAAVFETHRRRRPEYAEYHNASWVFPTCAEQLLQFLERCFANSENGVVCKHPCMSMFFPYYNANQPQRKYTVEELFRISAEFEQNRTPRRDDLCYMIERAISESPFIAEKYPDPADRTPHKLLGGLANIVSIEYMQTLEPHDPRRLFLETMNPPSEERRFELESNALLVDRAATEMIQSKPGDMNIREFFSLYVRDSIEENYLNTLKGAALLEKMRRQWFLGNDAEWDTIREGVDSLDKKLTCT
eukprot:gene9387-11050_t